MSGTTLSEGRGTTNWLELVGAPDLDFGRVLRRAQSFAPAWLDGCRLRPCCFCPTFQKHKGRLCSAAITPAATAKSVGIDVDIADQSSVANAARKAFQSGNTDLGIKLSEQYISYMKAKGQQVPNPSDAFKRMTELDAQGVDPYVAQGVAYGMYRQFSDPSTGDIGITDLRSNRSVRGEEGRLVGGLIREGTRHQEKFDANVKDFGEAVVKGNIGNTESTLSEVENYLSSLANKGVKDIPGYGATGWVPGVAITQEGQDLRTRIAKLSNIIIGTVHEPCQDGVQYGLGDFVLTAQQSIPVDPYLQFIERPHQGKQLAALLRTEQKVADMFEVVELRVIF